MYFLDLTLLHNQIIRKVQEFYEMIGEENGHSCKIGKETEEIYRRWMSTETTDIVKSHYVCVHFSSEITELSF